jgi:hypothetical protein
MFLIIDDVLKSGRRILKDLIKYMKEILVKYLEDSVIKPSDLYNKFNR